MHLSEEVVDTQAAEAARLPRIALTAAGGRSTSDLLRLAGVGATQFDLIAIRNERVANRVALHLALGGGFQIPPTP